MAKIIWSRESIMSHSNGYQEPIKYLCSACNAEVEKNNLICPKCGEHFENNEGE